MTDEVHKLGEVLRTAREAKGVDLARVERDTKIRERYLSALERGDYRDLPGAVYTQGLPAQLRRVPRARSRVPDRPLPARERSPHRRSARARRLPPRPLAARRSRAFVVTPGAVVAAILTILVGGFVA